MGSAHADGQDQRDRPRRHVLCAPDKFRGTADARELATAAARAALRCGWTTSQLPLADGGEGLLDAVGGEAIETLVTGPLGTPLLAEWRLLRRGADPLIAVIEMARASGLAAAGGRGRNDPLGATTRGTGELIRAAVEHGAQRIVVGCGGAATTDGGAGMLEVLGPDDLAGIELLGACDVTTPFLDAARIFGPQKGATPAMVNTLTARLEALADRYRDAFGIDVTSLPRTGAAGGLGGGLAVLGATLVSGFELVAQLVGFDEALGEADLVITGEGRLDATSFAGKVVGEVIRRAAPRAVPVIAVVGSATYGLAVPRGVSVISLTERFGRTRALADPLGLLETVVADALTVT